MLFFVHISFEKKKEMRWLACVLFILVEQVSGQSRWSGGAGTALWGDALNWESGIVPGATDDVLLDNSLFLTSYSITLPQTSVSVRSLRITPSGSAVIEIRLPVSNTLAPAFSVTGQLQIDSNAVFWNLGGATAGSNLVIGDSLILKNGGRYLHNTRSAHAGNILQVLSRRAGTERGVLEFDVPGGSYTVSITNRIFGSLRLSSNARGAPQAYNSIAANPCTIRGNLEIGNATTWNIDESAACKIEGSVNLSSAVLNLSSQNASNIFSIGGDLVADASSLITETGSGRPELLFNGGLLQHINCAGSIANEVNLAIDNENDVVLDHALKLPAVLTLIHGRINTTAINLLSLSPSCLINCDTLSTSFVSGPLRKEGLISTDHFLFPVGFAKVMRWLNLKQVTGSVTVQYKRNDPRNFGTVLSPGLQHISQIEYWDLLPDDPLNSSGTVELSFDNMNSGGVTDLSFLRVSSYNSMQWDDNGNAATTGSAGASGSVTSAFLPAFGNAHVFALASSVDAQNPLPLNLISFSANPDERGVLVHWHLALASDSAKVEIRRSIDGSHFSEGLHTNQSNGEWRDAMIAFGKSYYQLVARTATDSFFSKVISCERGRVNNRVLFDARTSTFSVSSSCEGKAQMIILDMNGRILSIRKLMLTTGVNFVTLVLPRGGSFVVSVDTEQFHETHLFVR